jgi:hypothetical protein
MVTVTTGTRSTPDTERGRQGRNTTLYARALAIAALAFVCSPQWVEGQDLSHYRNFALRSDLHAVSTLTGMPPSTAHIVHQRPALLQELEWRPSRWTTVGAGPSTDPVEQILFTFYNDQLFQVVVDYGQERTSGLTSADMIEAISVEYGTPLSKASRPGRAAPQLESESGAPVASWGDVEHSVVLFATSSYRPGYRLVLTDTRLADLAGKAAAQAIRLDDQEAPQREVARQKKEQEDGAAAAAKAREANKGVFRP